jgi:phosphatidylcholine synthase
VRRAAAWAVHAYTASGLVLAGLAAVLVVDGSPDALRRALLLLALATAVDASDGWLARRAGVAARLPGFDGRRLDDIVDFHTYTSVPLLLVWRSGVLPDAQAAWLLLPLLASAYGFAQADAKTPDGYFRGFPSYWNVVALYLHLLRPPPPLVLAGVVVLALLTFVPARYVYPSQPGRLNRVTTALGVAWAAVVVAVLLELPAEPRTWVLASLAFPAFYLAASAWVSLRAARPGAVSGHGAR